MTIGERIRKFRIMRGMTQKQLGIKTGLKENSADVRITQYESSYRTPSIKENIGISEPAIRNYELGNRKPAGNQLEKIANALDVNVYALADPELDTNEGVMHTLFKLKDLYSIHIDFLNEQYVLTLNSVRLN